MLQRLASERRGLKDNHLAILDTRGSQTDAGGERPRLDAHDPAPRSCARSRWTAKRPRYSVGVTPRCRVKTRHIVLTSPSPVRALISLMDRFGLLEQSSRLIDSDAAHELRGRLVEVRTEPTPQW